MIILIWLMIVVTNLWILGVPFGCLKKVTWSNNIKHDWLVVDLPL